jgi:hypothetical protein
MAAVPLTAATANHVKIDGSVESVTVPPGVAARTFAPVPSTIQADDIEAHQVRARTIYANRIEADQVQGVVHQSTGIRVEDTDGDVEAPDVAAGVIYADEIKANSVAADHIFVRDLSRR